jgi:hypothetical protein
MNPRTHRYVRVAAAVFVLLGGSVHLQQWLRIFHDLSIGPRFVVNVAASVLVGIGLLAFDGKWSAFVAVLLSVGTLGALIASRTVGLLGFSATGFETPEIEAIVFESLATVLLIVWLVAAPKAEPIADSSSRAHPEAPAAS